MSIDRIPTWGLWGTVRDAFTDLEVAIEDIEVGAPASAPDMWIDPRDYGAVANGTTTGSGTDNTAAFQDAINAGNVLPKRPLGFVGAYQITQLTFPEGHPGMYGVGIGSPDTHHSSVLIQEDGVNASAIKNGADLGSTDYWHWVSFRDFQLRKVTSETDTLGNGFHVNCRSGEGFNIARVLVVGFPEAGIRFSHGGVPTYLEDLHLFGNGTYGLDVSRTGSDDWQMFKVNTISGDLNTIALVRVANAGDNHEFLAFDGVKAESDGVRQLSVFEIDVASSSATISIGKLTSIGAIDQVIHVLSPSASINLDTIHAPSADNLIVHDGVRTVPYFKVGTVSYGVSGFTVLTSGGGWAFGPKALTGTLSTAASVGTYTESNVTVDRAYNADSTTTEELADVLGTLIADLRAQGLVK